MVNAKASESCRVGGMSVCEAARLRPFTGSKFTPVNDSEKQAQQSIHVADGQNECHGDQVVVMATYSFLRPKSPAAGSTAQDLLSEVRANLGTSCSWNRVRCGGSAHTWSSIVHQHVTTMHPSQYRPQQSKISASYAP